MTRRMARLNVLLRQVISRVVTSQLKDPRLASMVSITHVDCSPDLKHARVFVSVLGDSDAKKRSLSALKSAGGFVQRATRAELTTKTVPTLEFHLDESIEQGEEMLQKIRDLTAQDPNIKQ